MSRFLSTATGSALALAALLAATPSAAATLYVATNGSDNNSGTSVSSAFATLQKAADAAVAGDVIEVRGGSYPGFRVGRLAGHYGTANAWIRMRPYAGEHVKITTAPGNLADFAILFRDDECWNEDVSEPGCPSMYWSIEGMEITGGNYYVLKLEARHIRLLDNEIYGSPNDLIKLVRSADDVLIEGNNIHHPLCSGDNCNSQGIDAVGVERLVVRRNHIHDINSVGAYAKGGAKQPLFEFNLVERVATHGLMLGQSTDDWLLFGAAYESYDGIIRNNVIIESGGACVATGSSLNPRIYNNSCLQAAKTYSGGIYITRDNDYTSPGKGIMIANNSVHVAGGRPAVMFAPGAVANPADVHIDHNLFWSPSGAAGVKFSWEDRGIGFATFAEWQAQAGLDSHSLVANPAYGNNADLSLSASSPAMDKGDNANCAPTDYRGRPRPQDDDGNGVATCDIGAYEGTAPFDGADAGPPADGGQAGDSGQPPVETPTCVTASAGSSPQFLSEPIAPQAGTFKARWEVTPLAADTDGLTGLSQGSAGGWSGVAAIVRFAATGQVDARNGSEYQAVSAASWNAQQTYEVRVQVDLAAHSWSAWIAPKGGTEVQLANGFAFRSEQAEVASLDHFVVGAETGSLQACSFLLGDKPAGDAGAPEGQGGAAGNPGAGGASGTAGAAGSSAAGAPGAAGTSSSNGVSDPSDAGDGGSCTVASRPASPAPSWFAFALLALVGAAAARRSRAGQWRAA